MSCESLLTDRIDTIRNTPPSLWSLCSTRTLLHIRDDRLLRFVPAFVSAGLFCAVFDTLGPLAPGVCAVVDTVGPLAPDVDCGLGWPDPGWSCSSSRLDLGVRSLALA